MNAHSIYPLTTTPGQNISEHRGELFVATEAPRGLAFVESLEVLLRDYHTQIQDRGLTTNTEVYVRFYLSDIANQSAPLRQKLLSRQANETIYSMVGQAPASGSKVALIAYHLASNMIQKSRASEQCLEVEHGAYRSIWSSDHSDVSGTSYEQTEQIFNALARRSEDHGGSVRDNLMRTWCYIRDIDNNYQGFVDAREKFFRSIGLNRDTHYIASTGIEACNTATTELVTVDALTMIGLEDEQIEYMEALAHLCPTHDYNVSFERATRIVFGDRSHYYISGTASIDRFGEVVHVGDVLKQAERTVENISALLTPYGANLEDLCSLTVYLRDSADYEVVERFLEKRLPAGVPYVIVRGAVCRPKWLIEIEGIAISDFRDERFAPYFACS